MGKRAKIALGTLALLGAGWSGAWVWGKGAIQAQIDDQIVLMREQGVYASYKDIEIEGFPFAYRGRMVQPRYQAVLASDQGMGQTLWTAPWLTFDAKVQELGAVDFVLPEMQSMTITPPGSQTPINVTLTSESFTGRVAPSGAGLGLTADAKALTVTATPAGEPPYAVVAETVSIDGVLPGQEAGEMRGALSVGGAQADDRTWDALDPSRSFPRNPANIALSMTADTVERLDAPPVIQSVQIQKISVDAVGLKLEGEGAAALTDTGPDGTVSLRVNGLGGFFDKLATTGRLPAQQVAVFKVMLESLGRKGTQDGEKVYAIAFKDGTASVNGMQIPASFLPR